MIMATLETAMAVENAKAIAAVPGIDVLTMGMNDLSVVISVAQERASFVRRCKP
jgi:2-keto-3-deoxy-L-rhamnonate aldolase RhmA